MAFLPSSPDLRDLYRPDGGPSRMTLRRLYVLILALPPEAPVWHQLRLAEERAEQQRLVDHIKQRKAHYAAKARARSATTQTRGESP